MSIHSPAQTHKRPFGTTLMVLALQAVLALSLFLLTGSDFTRRLHPLSSDTPAFTAASHDLSAVNSGSNSRLLAAPEQQARAKARPPEPSGDAILPSLDYLASGGDAGQLTASSPNPVLASPRHPFQPRAPPLSSL